MARLIFRAVITLSFVNASALAQGGRAEETITLSRVPMGLHSADAPDFDVTLAPDGEVAVLRRSYNASYAIWKRSTRTETYRVSAIEAARFRAALMPHKPATEGPKIICGGQVYGLDNQPLVRVPVFHIEWKGARSGRALTVCITRQEKEIVDDVRQGLEALHLTLEGSRI